MNYIIFNINVNILLKKGVVMEEKFERMRMYFLENGDETLEGLEFQGYKLLKVNEDWLSYWLPANEIEWLKSRDRGNIKKQWFILCKELEQNEPDLFDIQKSFNIALHIYYDTNAFIKFTVLGRRKNNIISGPAGDGLPDILQFDRYNTKNSPIEKDKLQPFLNIYNYINLNIFLKTALDTFYLCLQSDNINLRFILLIITLEILFLSKDDKYRKTKKLSHNIAVFLGKTEFDSNEINENIINFYNYRSQFIHAGNSVNIKEDTLYELSEYVRKILKCMIIKTDILNDKEAYIKVLNESAFGDNPYHIE